DQTLRCQKLLLYVRVDTRFMRSISSHFSKIESLFVRRISTILTLIKKSLFSQYEKSLGI
ncbi:MAG: hypothetical protein KAV45_06275, partial [Calditrichia bacterium]|nr:hypothetical protein [Calditrichia bacterium]